MSLLPQRKKSAEEIAKLRDSLGVPATPAAEKEAPAAAAPHPAAGPAETSARSAALKAPKPVRSLRKSEQVPILVAAPAEPTADSKLPVHRHSDEEIAEIRRREALAMMTPPPPNPKLAAAHFALLIPGYLCAIAGASCFFFAGFPMAATVVCAATALLVAGFIFLQKPISRHHAAFISVIALFVIVFGTLHYFPQLRHAT